MLIRTQFSIIGNKHINKSVRDTAGKKIAILGDIKITWVIRMVIESFTEG